MIRFIHLADVHLGAVPDRGCLWSHEREEEIWETFRRVIAAIRKNPVDLLFIAGDLFHHQPLMSQLEEINELLWIDPGYQDFSYGRRSGLCKRRFFLQTDPVEA